MHIVLPLLALLVLILGPGLWVRRIMRRYSRPADRYSMTGAEIARQLLDAHELHTVGTELTEAGDHYDPHDKMVRLSKNHYSGKSLAAIVIAAHEVGHAVQDASGYTPLYLRTRLVQWVGPVQKLGAGLLISAPLIIAVTRAPMAGGLMLLGGLLSMGSAVLVHLLTLPAELDASYNRALPMLTRHDVLIPGDEPHARRLLRAAALTYVSASLLSLLNIARWWAILRR